LILSPLLALLAFLAWAEALDEPPLDGWLRALVAEASQSPPEPVDPEPTLPHDALVIAACESGARLSDGSARLGTHRWEAVNGDRGGHPPRSTASGAFQFLDGTWEWVWRDLLGEPAPTPRAKQASPSDQLRAFLALWDDRRGSSHWDASRSCWAGML